MELHEAEINGKKETIDLLHQIKRNTDKILDQLLSLPLQSPPSPEKKNKKKKSDEHHPPLPENAPKHLSKALLSYLENYRNNPRQYNALKETLSIIVSNGGTATSTFIKEQRGFSRTTLIKGQIDRLVADGIIERDDSRKPYVVKLKDRFA